MTEPPLPCLPRLQLMPHIVSRARSAPSWFYYMHAGSVVCHSSG